MEVGGQKIGHDSKECTNLTDILADEVAEPAKKFLKEIN
jgi:hypothetical protein